jgi:homoserine acetyltransferase
MMGSKYALGRSISLSAADHTGSFMKTSGVSRHGTTMAAILLGLFLSNACAYGQQQHTGDDMQTTTKSSLRLKETVEWLLKRMHSFDNYRFRDGKILPRLRIHYSTLGSPRRNSQGQIDNALLVIHWTGADARSQAISIDANDILYSLSSSADYDPQPGLAAIKTKVYALNFADDEFNPVELPALEELMPKVHGGRFIVQPASARSLGHLTMAHPELWSEHLAELMRSLGDGAPKRSYTLNRKIMPQERMT